MNQLNTIYPFPLNLGEGPIWDERIQVLYFVDILDKKLFAWHYNDKKSVEYQFEEYISCLALTTSTHIIQIALESGLYRYDLNTKVKQFVIRPEKKNNYRYNDGKVNWQGEWILGSMNNINNGPNATHLPDATLYRVQENESSTLLEGVTISNGLAFQNPYVYFIDSKLNNIRKFNDHTRELHLESIVFQLEDDTSLDGMTLSQSNKLYIANWGGSQIIIFDLVTNQIVDTIALPALNPTSCTFGGTNMNELFITTSQIGENKENIKGVYSILLNDYGTPEFKIKL